MTKPLDPRFFKVIALMRSTEHEGERVYDMRSPAAEAMARKAQGR